MLRRTPLGERDDLLLLLGQASGRFSAVSKGSRGGRRSGAVEPPVELQASFIEGRTLDTLQQPSLVQAFTGLRGDLNRLLTAGFLSRLFLAALPEKARVEGVYELLVDAFTRLSQAEAVVPVALWAQGRLLRELGLAPELGECVGCGSPSVAGFSAVDGGLLCSACYAGQGFAVSSEVVTALRFFEQEQSPHSDCPASVTREVGRVYKHQLKHHLDLPERLFRRVLSQEGPL